MSDSDLEASDLSRDRDPARRGRPTEARIRQRGDRNASKRATARACALWSSRFIRPTSPICSNWSIRDDRRALAAALADLLDGDVLAEMNEWVREDLLDALEPHQVAEIAGELETDDAVAIIEDMEEEDQRAVLRALDPDDRAAIEEALSYPEESAGRLMRRDAVAVPEHWTIGQVIDYLRAADDLPTDFWEVFVVDPAHRPVGTCLLSWILTHAAADRGRRRDAARADPDPGRHGPGGSGAPLPEICPDLRGRGRSGRAAGRHDHRRRRRPHHPGGSERGRLAALRRGRPRATSTSRSATATRRGCAGSAPIC